MVKRLLAILLALAFLPCQSFGQIDLTYTNKKTLVGATVPEVLEGGRILVGDDSQVAESMAALIKVASTHGVRLIAMKGGDDIELIAVGEESKDATSGIITKRYLLIGEGEYSIKALSRFNDSWDVSSRIIVGKPKPIPPKPDPTPDPPKPDPTPIPPVKNDYNVGAIAFKTAPVDQAMAKQIAGWYRIGASQLYGIGGLNDINRIKANIDKQFASKQCKDQATCMQWDKWKTAVASAFVDEQTKRKVFTREDWFAAMVEVAEGLEAVK